MKKRPAKVMLKYITDRQKRTAWLRAFRLWQKRKPRLAPVSEETHECNSCHHTYTGNYCPRCGQAAGVGRFSFKKAILLFLDVWGMGNRSFFRTLRDLMFRPGYAIHDYIGGMQSAYFPPFKLFFVLAALGVLIEHGIGSNETKTETITPPPVSINADDAGQEHYESVKEKEVILHIEKSVSDLKVFRNKMRNLSDENPAIFSLLLLVMLNVPMYFFLRKSPKLPDMRYSEFIVAQVYISNASSIYSTMGQLLNIPLFKLLGAIITIVAFKQFTGFSKRRILLYLAITFVIIIVAIVALCFLALGLFYVKHQLMD